ncbi:Na+/H+ antiporter [Humitalea sp. 24SJ18S-53]|uniref:Na+/H+ antiporter n=1 Tax=Humitalea sp. 24SJ18S-53 TaxID=3422307 RepID=UPI003D66F241
MAIVETLLALLAACVLMALVARRLGLPYAVVLVLGGSALAFVPGLPQVALDPQIALAFFLPPLLMVSAYRTDWRAFRKELRPILFLAVGAVFFTAACIAIVAKLLVPDLPWAAAIALGAIVAPPDAVAAAAVLQRLRLPRRMVIILEGESLVNDAASLVLYRLAVAGVAAGGFEWQQGIGQFSLSSAGGVAIGYVLARACIWATMRLNDTLLETTLTFLVCFASFLTAESVHVSGVIAVVTTGIMLGQAQHSTLTARTRMEARAVWVFVDFVLTSLVFILVGLQLQEILEALSVHDAGRIATVALVLSVVLIASRFLWLFPATWVALLIPYVRRHHAAPPWQNTVVIGWAGMRGVVSLAAALALPLEFPHRPLIVFLAFCAIFATLILQGTTLEWLIRKLGVELPPRRGMEPEEAVLRRLVSQAAATELQSRLDSPLDGAIAADLLPEFREKARVFHDAAEGASRAELTARLQLRLSALRAGREALLVYHRETALSDEHLMVVSQDLDFEELRLKQLLHGNGHG